MKEIINLNHLVSTIQNLHFDLQKSAVNAVNQLLTIRNWLIGYSIVEFEQNGKGRAEYGQFLLKSIAEKLQHIKGMDERSLRRFRQFYLYYPYLSEAIRGSMPPEFHRKQKWETLSPVFNITEKVGTLTPQFEVGLFVPGDKILSKLSYSHIELLLGISETLKRTFYEMECIKNGWSVRELKRQINSQYFERSGLSKNPEKLAEMIKKKTKPQAPNDIIKNIYAFEFLNLPVKEIVEETDLEKALLDNLQNFISELGYGFCFEARQKRILIGEKYYFIDLVFYHRILKCHILIELKMGEFEHGDIGQLNTYLNYYKTEICDRKIISRLGFY
jgi:predicted nuclease of restriction endonuclease-like (RecB) superfamily